MKNGKFNLMFVFHDGEKSPIAEVKDETVRACLTDPHVQNIAKGLLKVCKKTSGLLVLWGRGKIEQITVHDETKLKQRSEVPEALKALVKN